MDRDRNSSSVSSILSVGIEDTSRPSMSLSPIDSWLQVKEKLILNIEKAGFNHRLLSSAIKCFKETLDNHTNCPEIRAEKAKYGLGPPEYLYSETSENPCDVKSALWVCILKGNCHKDKQTKILIKVESDLYFDELKKVNFEKPKNEEVPIFLCAYHFTEPNQATSIYSSSVFLRHWFRHLSIPEGIELRLTVRSANTRPRRATGLAEELWDLLKRGILLDDLALSKMKGANAV
jgi:hypothetical protein